MAIRNFYIEILSRHGKEPAKWPKVLQLFEYITENTEGVVSHIYSGNMPEWAVNDLPLFFECMERDERRNATMCRHVSGPIPRELNTDQGIALVKKFMAKITDKYKLPFVVAFHDLQTHAPHYHGLISERSTLDAIPRGPELFFIRANPENPEEGGAPKATIASKEWRWVSRTIDLWTEFVNAALKAAGSSKRIDRRTLIEKRANRIALPYLKESVLQMEERGIKTKVMDIYIGIEEINNNAQDIKQIKERCDYEDDANELKLAKKKSQLVEESANLPAKGIEKNAERFIREIKEFIEERNKEIEKHIEAINCKMIKNEKIAEEMKLICLEIEDKSGNGSKKKIYLFGRKRQTAYEIVKENLENEVKQLNERKEERAEYYSRELTRCRLGICIYKQLAEEIQAKQYEQTEETEVKQLDTVRKTEQKENQKIPEVMVIKVENFPGINEFIKILREGTPHFIESNGKIIESYPNELDKNDYYLAEDGTAKLKNAEQKGVDRHDTKQVATTKKTEQKDETIKQWADVPPEEDADRLRMDYKKLVKDAEKKIIDHTVSEVDRLDEIKKTNNKYYNQKAADYEEEKPKKKWWQLESAFNKALETWETGKQELETWINNSKEFCKTAKSFVKNCRENAHKIAKAKVAKEYPVEKAIVDHIAQKESNTIQINELKNLSSEDKKEIYEALEDMNKNIKTEIDKAYKNISQPGSVRHDLAQKLKAQQQNFKNEIFADAKKQDQIRRQEKLDQIAQREAADDKAIENYNIKLVEKAKKQAEKFGDQWLSTVDGNDEKLINLFKEARVNFIETGYKDDERVITKGHGVKAEDYRLAWGGDAVLDEKQRDTSGHDKNIDVKPLEKSANTLQSDSGGKQTKEPVNEIDDLKLVRGSDREIVKNAIDGFLENKTPLLVEYLEKDGNKKLKGYGEGIKGDDFYYDADDNVVSKQNGKKLEYEIILSEGEQKEAIDSRGNPKKLYAGDVELEFKKQEQKDLDRSFFVLEKALGKPKVVDSWKVSAEKINEIEQERKSRGHGIGD